MADHLETDLLVIGGGAAGMWAAMTAAREGVRVLVAVKGFMGRSGGSIYAGNLLRYASGGQQRSQIADRVRVGYYLIDPDYVQAATAFAANRFYSELEALGLYVRRVAGGAIISNRQQGALPVTWAHKQGVSGLSVSGVLRQQVLKHEIPVLEETMATSLLMGDGRVAGATLYNYRDGSFTVVRARAVILATGYLGYLATRATGTRDQCANGHAMAYHAGADLQGLEIQFWHVSDIAWPKAWMRLHMYPNVMPETAEVARLYNSRGQYFFSQNMYPFAYAPYYLQAKHLAREVDRGRARWDGGYYSSCRHIDPEVLRQYSATWGFMKKLGIDVTKDLIECGMTWHMTLGGVRNNVATMASSLPGLYVAGGVGSHITGAINYVVYDGEIAAQHALDFMRTAKGAGPDRGAVEAEEQRVLGMLGAAPSDGCSPAQVKVRIRAVMWERMGYAKDEAGMRAGLAELRDIRETMLPRMRVSATRRFNYDVVDALDARDMLDVCELVIRASLTREESRGPFYRRDFPEIDNARWLRHIVLRRGADGPEITTVPIDLRGITPDREREDFLTADY